jgi:hypothetical protein
MRMLGSNGPAIVMRMNPDRRDYVHVRHDADPKLLTAGAVSVA